MYCTCSWKYWFKKRHQVSQRNSYLLSTYTFCVWRLQRKCCLKAQIISLAILELHRKPNVFAAPTITRILRPAKNFLAIASYWAVFGFVLRWWLEGFISLCKLMLVIYSIIDTVKSKNIYLYLNIRITQSLSLKAHEKRCPQTCSPTWIKLRGVGFSCLNYYYIFCGHLCIK